MGFFANLFKGSQNETKNEEYTQFLLGELENLKKATNEAIEKEQNSKKELQARLDQEQKEKENLQKQIEDYEREKEDFLEKGKQLEENEKKFAEMAKKLKDYEDSYAALSGLVAAAKRDAEFTVSKAKDEAKQTTTQAKCEAEYTVGKAKEEAKEIVESAQKEAFAFRKNVETELKAKERENEQKYIVAKYKLREYLDVLNKTQSKLIETYNELGAIVEKMPIRLEDVFAEETPTLFSEHEESKNKSEESKRETGDKE